MIVTQRRCGKVMAAAWFLPYVRFGGCIAIGRSNYVSAALLYGAFAYVWIVGSSVSNVSDPVRLGGNEEGHDMVASILCLSCEDDAQATTFTQQRRVSSAGLVCSFRGFASGVGMFVVYYIVVISFSNGWFEIGFGEVVKMKVSPHFVVTACFICLHIYSLVQVATYWHMALNADPTVAVLAKSTDHRHGVDRRLCRSRQQPLSR